MKIWIVEKKHVPLHSHFRNAHFGHYKTTEKEVWVSG